MPLDDVEYDEMAKIILDTAIKEGAYQFLMPTTGKTMMTDSEILER